MSRKPNLHSQHELLCTELRPVKLLHHSVLDRNMLQEWTELLCTELHPVKLLHHSVLDCNSLQEWTKLHPVKLIPKKQLHIGHSSQSVFDDDASSPSLINFMLVAIKNCSV